MNDIFVILQILADPIFLGWDKDVWFCCWQTEITTKLLPIKEEGSREIPHVKERSVERGISVLKTALLISVYIILYADQYIKIFFF
jgi:hypothetical protein